MTDSSSDTPEAGDDAPTAAPAEDDEIDRRRLIRWIAVLAFAVPVVVEALTFGNIIGDELLPGGDEATDTATATPTDHPDAVGVGDELLPATAASETIEQSEIRESDTGRTYVLQVEVRNDTDAPIELRLRTLRLRDDSTVDGVSSTGTVEPGSSSPVTAAWSIPSETAPAAVQAVAIRDEETVVDEFVPIARPTIDD